MERLIRQLEEPSQENVAAALECTQAAVSRLTSGIGSGRDLTLRIMDAYRREVHECGLDAEDFLRGQVRRR